MLLQGQVFIPLTVLKDPVLKPWGPYPLIANEKDPVLIVTLPTLEYQVVFPDVVVEYQSVRQDPSSLDCETHEYLMSLVEAGDTQKLVGQRRSHGSQPAHSRTAPPKWSVDCTLDYPTQKFNGDLFGENVNELVSTLGMDTAIPEDATPSLSRAVPLTPENMTRREREISRRNKPLKDPTALRNAFKIEPASSTESGSQSQEFKRPIALNRSRYGRLGGVRPNLASAGLHRPFVNHSVQQSGATEGEADKPSSIGSSFVKTEIFLDTKPYPSHSTHDGEVAAINNTEGTSTELSNIENTTSTPSCAEDPVPVQPATDECGTEAPTTSVNGSTLLTRAKRIKPRITRPVSASEQSKSIQEATSENDEIEVIGESTVRTLDQEEPAGNLLRRGRRSLIKPRVEPSPSDTTDGEKPEVVSSANEGGPEGDATSTTEDSASNLLRRGRRPMLKPIIAPSTVKKDDFKSSKNESPTSESQEQLEKNVQGETTLQRGRRLLVKPKLPSAPNGRKDGETSKDNGEKTCTNEQLIVKAFSRYINAVSLSSLEVELSYSELQTAVDKGRDRQKRTQVPCRSRQTESLEPMSLPKIAAPRSRPLSTAVWSSLYIRIDFRVIMPNRNANCYASRIDEDTIHMFASEVIVY
ncbi:hypothetical protein Y032_0687g1530 [Ancylostoma ceylanicum]|uniref:Uncharacterized protein n=2 Tax=Ancylostoma ceylanicum TaxID=53326 RepID=A0A016WH02_9BILA|nr:hypothetical protein Y032_0687g1530 [Ancylostoma ceylanicum]